MRIVKDGNMHGFNMLEYLASTGIFKKWSSEKQKIKTDLDIQ